MAIEDNQKAYIFFVSLRTQDVKMEQKSTFDNRIVIRVVLEGDLAKKFNLIKTRKGIKNNTELIRLLVAEEFARSS